MRPLLACLLALAFVTPALAQFDGGPDQRPHPARMHSALVPQYPRTIIVLHADTSIANSTFAAFSWSASDIVQDDLGAWSSGSATRLTVPYGRCGARITSDWQWATNSTGDRWAYIIVSGTGNTLLEDNRPARNEGAGSAVSVPLMGLKGGTDYFEFNYAQSSGGALNLRGSTSPTSPATRAMIEWLPC